MQKLTAKWLECWQSHQRIRENFERLGGDRDSTRSPRDSTNLDIWGLPETESATKEDTYILDLAPPFSLIFLWVPQQIELGLSGILVPACGSCSLNYAFFTDLSGRGFALFCSGLMFQDSSKHNCLQRDSPRLMKTDAESLHLRVSGAWVFL